MKFFKIKKNNQRKEVFIMNQRGTLPQPKIPLKLFKLKNKPVKIILKDFHC